MSDLETLLPKKGSEQAQEKQTAETKPTQSSFAERKQKCLYLPLHQAELPQAGGTRFRQVGRPQSDQQEIC